MFTMKYKNEDNTHTKNKAKNKSAERKLT